MKNKAKTTLVLLSGWGFYASIWESIAAQLPDCQVVQIDLPLIVNPNIVDVAFYCLLEKIPQDAIVVAWSMSGLFALHLANLYPARFRKIILVNSSPKFLAAPGWPGISALQAKRFLQQLQTHVAELATQFQQWTAHPSMDANVVSALQQHHHIVAAHQDVLLQYLTYLFAADYRTMLATCDVPLCFLFGADDAIVPVATANALPPAVDVKVVPHAGHVLFLSHSAAFLHTLTEQLYADCA